MFKNNEAIERSYERMREEIKRVESSGLEIDVKKLMQEELDLERSRARKIIDKEMEQVRAASEAALSKVERQCLRELRAKERREKLSSGKRSRFFSLRK